MSASCIHAPKDYRSWLGEDDVHIFSTSKAPWDFVHLFVNRVSELEDQLYQLRTRIKPDGMIWVSWYKKTSGKESEITEDIIRDTCLPLGLVDIKVCAVSEEWSGLKLVIRKELRKNFQS